MMSRRAAAALAVLVAGFALLYGDVLRKLAHQWGTDDNYSHGYLVVPLALFFVWQRRASLVALPLRPSAVGLVVIAASLGVLAAGVLGSELFLTRISMLGVLAGTVLFVCGRDHLRVLAFPLAFLVLMIPLPAILFNQIAFPLQLIASQAGEAALHTAGVPVLREGNVLHLATTSLEVVEACSGIRSLVSLLTMGVLLAHFSPLGPAGRVLLVASAVPIAVLTNAARVAGTGWAAHHWGPGVSDGFLHTFSGGAVFFAALGLLLVAQQGFLLAPGACALRRRHARPEAAEEAKCSPGR
jgi:exosortase